MNKYRNVERDAQLDRELAEEEAAYRKQFGGEPQENEEPATPLEASSELPAVGKDEETWKKRHGDLRSYTAKQLNEKDKELQDLRDQLARKEREATALPTNKAEAEQWVKDYPDLARVLSTLMEQQTDLVRDDVQKVRHELEAERTALARERAMNSILEVHSDFLTLINQDDFKQWVEDQPEKRGRIGQAYYDALYRNETDALAAIEAVNVYKSDKRASQPRRDNSERDAASVVRKTASSSPATEGGKKRWTETEIERLSARDFDRFEQDIEDARLEGRIDYDISGAAR